MEAYFLAMVAMKEEIPLLYLKYISDGADGSAAKDCSYPQGIQNLPQHSFIKLSYP